jgi:hypothetical protein
MPQRYLGNARAAVQRNQPEKKIFRASHRFLQEKGK